MHVYSAEGVVQPEKVFAEIYRVLKPGGSCIVTFSNRLFYDKACIPACTHLVIGP